MAEEQITPTPDAPATAPVADASAAPALPSAPLPAVDLSGLAQPAQPSATGTQEYQDAVQGENTALKNVQEASKPTPPPAPVPHARLLAMVNGLANGLAAAATSIGTGGREGGAKEVTEIQGEEQRQKLERQQSVLNQKNALIQQQLTVADTNHKLAQNILFMATLPNELAKSDLDLAAGKTALAGAQQEQSIQGADFQAQHGGLTPEQFKSALSSDAPVSQPGGTNTFFTTSAQQQVDAAKLVLGSNDPYMRKVQKVLADPKATAKDLWTATSQLQNQLQLQSKATDERSKKETADANSPVSKLSTPEALAAPGAQAAIQAKIDDPKTDPVDIPRLRALLPQAAVAQFNAETIKQREMRNQQLVNQGSPDQAGQLLANRSLTLSELKSRNVTPKFISDAIIAAQKFDPTYKAAEADAQAKTAGSAANQQFFGNTDSLLVRGGTLDQLAAAYNALGNTEIPAINKLENLRKAAIGNGPLAAAYAAQLGVADDYSKVMTGGTGSDTSRQQALDIMSANMSPAAQAAGFAAIRKAVQSQRNGRIGTNPYIQDMYPDPSTRKETPGVAGTQSAPQSSPAAKVHANLSDFTHHFAGAKGTIYSDDLSTWYDQNGNRVK